MAVFTARRFKLPGSGSASAALSMARNQLAIIRSKAERFGLSPGELQNLVDKATELKATLTDVEDRVSMDVLIEGYKSELQKLNDRREGLDNVQSYFDSQKQDIEAQAKYMAGNNPVQYLSGVKEGYDRLIGSYNDNIKNRGESDDVTALSLNLDELVRSRNEVVGMLKAIEGNKGGAKDLEGIAYVITPDANGGIADVSIKPRRLLKSGEFRTDVVTPEGIPVYVVPNQDVLGTKQAVIGNSIFKESKFDALSKKAELDAQVKSGAITPEQANTMFVAELSNPNKEVTFSLEGDQNFDIGGVKVDTSIPDGDYGVGANGTYRRVGNSYQRVDQTPQQLGLKPWQYRRLDSSLETSIQPLVTQVQEGRVQPPTTFDVPAPGTAPGSLGAAPAEEPPFEASVPVGPVAPPRKPQEARGLERIKGLTSKIFGGMFGQGNQS